MNLVELAIRIKNLRKQQNITLDELAGRVGVTESLMSKIENFRVTPSLNTVSGVAQALGTSLSELFAGLDQLPQLTVVRRDKRRKITRDNSPWEYFPLVDEETNRRVDPFLVDIPPEPQRPEAHAHEGHEFIFVLQGSIEFHYDERVIELEEGDSVYADGTVRHNLVNNSGHNSRILVVFCNPFLPGPEGNNNGG